MPKGGGCWLQATLPKYNLENTDFVDIVISDVSRDLPYS